MSKKITPMTHQAARRIVSSTAINNGGKIPPKSVASRVYANVQRKQAAAMSSKESKD